MTGALGRMVGESDLPMCKVTKKKTLRHMNAIKRCCLDGRLDRRNAIPYSRLQKNRDGPKRQVGRGDGDFWATTNLNTDFNNLKFYHLNLIPAEAKNCYLVSSFSCTPI